MQHNSLDKSFPEKKTKAKRKNMNMTQHLEEHIKKGTERVKEEVENNNFFNLKQLLHREN